MARVLFTMGDVQRAYFAGGYEVIGAGPVKAVKAPASYQVISSTPSSGGYQVIGAGPVKATQTAAATATAAAAAAPKSATQAAKEAAESASTYTRRTARGAMVTVRKNMNRARRAVRRAIGPAAAQGFDEIGSGIKRIAGGVDNAAGGALAHVGRNKLAYGIGAGAAAIGGAAYLMNRNKNRENYSRQVRTVYFSRRSY